MGQADFERRRGKRAKVETPLLLRRVGAGKSEPFIEQMAKNVSLAGVYFETDQAQTFSLHDAFTASIAIPEAQRRDFPFARLAGPSRVVRITELPASEGGTQKRVGVALEFGDDITMLTATPWRG